MTPVLLVNSAVSLIVGAALLFVWQRDAAQRFCRDLGAAFLVQSMAPPVFLLWRAGPPPWNDLGAALLVACAVAYLMLMITGASQLASRRLSRATLWALVIALLVVVGTAISFEPRVAQAITSSAQLLVACVAASWLWRLGRAERLTGVLLILLGMTHFGYAAFGEAALPAQAGIGAVLRVGLGMALLYAAVNRSTAESHRLREHFTRMVERSHQGVAVMRGEQLLYANPALLRIYGLDRLEDAIGNWRDTTMPAEERAAGRERHRRIVAGLDERLSWEGRRFRADGTPLHLRFSAWRIDWDGAPAEQVVVTDETAHHDTMRTLLHQATHDELTGLPNRSALLQRLRDLCGAEPRSPFALLLLDIDRFKLFNEAHGPSLGDAVLKGLAQGLGPALPRPAELMRLGEDEFALLACADDAEAAAVRLVAALRAFVREPLALADTSHYLDLSIGIALHPGTATDPEALLRAAHAAMHEAKRTPGTSFQFAEERFERGSGSALAVEQALRSGLRNDEFRLAYQPKIDAASGALIGFEALARWERRDEAITSPQDFIAAAERTGLIGALGEVILLRACRQLAAWQDRFPSVVPVAVNVSPLQLLDPGFPDFVLTTLSDCGLAPGLLTLELTESAAVTHMAEAQQQVERLRAHGVEIALDDFGTGFSSLNMLRGLPLRALKIDRSLIEPLPAADATAVVKAICDLAGVLGLDVVAEGVENHAQAGAARDAGCQILQGDLFAPALPAADAARWLHRGEAAPPRGGPWSEDSELEFQPQLPVHEAARSGL